MDFGSEQTQSLRALPLHCDRLRTYRPSVGEETLGY